MISLSLERPPPEPSPHVNHVSSTSMERPPPKPPILQITVYNPSIMNLNLVRPPRKPPDKACTILKVVRKPEPYLGRLSLKPPWMIFSLGCLLLVELCFIYFVFFVVFMCYLCCIVICVLCLCLMGCKPLSFDCWRHTSLVAFYEDESDSKPLSFIS